MSSSPPAYIQSDIRGTLQAYLKFALATVRTIEQLPVTPLYLIDKSPTIPTATDEYNNVSTSQTSVVVQVCTSNLLGDYTVAHDCSIDVGLGPIDILNNDQTVLEGTNENEIIIDNFNAFVTQVSGTIEGNTVTIPETTTDILSGAATVSISGVGTINATATEMIITFSYSYDAGFLGTGSGTCTATYTKV